MEQYITRKELEKYLKAMAMLDIVMVSKKDAWLRLVSLSKKEKVSIYRLDNGSGDNILVLFTEEGVLIKGFDHESELNQFAADEWDASFFEYIFAGLPKELESFLNEDDRDNTTFCMWCVDDTDMWIQNEIDNDDEEDGGKGFLLRYICKTPEDWIEWAKDYYEAEFEKAVVQKIYNEETLTEEDFRRINPECNVAEVMDELEEIF